MIVVPATTTTKDILIVVAGWYSFIKRPRRSKIFDYAIKMIKDFLIKICRYLVFALVINCRITAGGDTYKLKFGHRGINQPVNLLKTKIVSYVTKSWICCQSKLFPPNGWCHSSILMIKQ